MNNPTIVFIDDSATMREVIKIAFRRENIEVVAYSDAATALGQMEKSAPDVVITDVIMPDKDGYEVCQFIKQHPTLNRIPVILMSGVVNRSVAERAFSVKADELIRKPFQPQDLITRVKHLLVGEAAAPPAPSQPDAVAALSSIFGAGASVVPRGGPRPMPVAVPAPLRPVAVAAPVSQPPTTSPLAAAPAPVLASLSRGVAPAANGDQKLRMEVMRLEGLLKKVQSELQAEKDYSKSLEDQLKAHQQAM